jgi:hypothetical protein
MRIGSFGLSKVQQEVADSLFFNSNLVTRNDVFFSFALCKARDHDAQKSLLSRGIRHFIILDMSDMGKDTIECMPELINQSLKLFYVKLQIYNRNDPVYDVFKRASHLCLLTMPMLLGGSTYHIDCEDNNTDYLFKNNLLVNPKNYDYDICMINASNKYRAPIFWFLDTIKEAKGRLRILSVNANKPREHSNEAEIPFTECINSHIKSKVNISTNGNGMWCLKDAELFSRNCFNIRQSHPNLTLNCLTPLDGVHWSVFNETNLIDTLAYYIDNDAEREKINDNGFNYFKKGIEQDFANFYCSRISSYIKNGNKNSLNGLLL